MRLLRRKQRGVYKPTKDFPDHETPPYAILSHTWGNKEVTFEEFTASAAGTKEGYKKIKFCGEQAASDGLEYFWIDTCCINKSNKAELTTAINSMFQWYSNAVRCYVYLSDVSVPSSASNIPPPSQSWESDFRTSRWFERGWTLQELLAPSQVEFFSSEGTSLGSKASLEQLIHEITGIPVIALRGEPLATFDIEERFTWAKDRKTSHEEDKAYSLLGIFGVYITPDYGETKLRAMDRLRTAIDTSKKYFRVLCNTDPNDDKKRIEEEKGGLLNDVYHWVLMNDAFFQWRHAKQSLLLWVKGDPGKGKTMLLCGIINELKKSGSAPSYFFYQAANNRVNNATAALRGLIYMLVFRQPSLLRHVQKKYDQVGVQLFEGDNAWVAMRQLFLDILRHPALHCPCLIVDALDECQTGREQFLDLIIFTCTNFRVKWLVSSRNWPDIEEKLIQPSLPLSLELNAKSISAAVQLYIRHQVDSLAVSKSYDAQTTAEVISYLSAHAKDTFLWVALVCHALGKVHRVKALKMLKSFPTGLDALYLRMLEQIRSLDDKDDADLCWQILAIACTVYRPVTLDELGSLLDWPDRVLTSSQVDAGLLTYLVELCGSFLTIRENTVLLVHQSVKDFIWNPSFNHSFLQIFPNKIRGIHYRLFTKSIFLLSTILQRNIYQLSHPGITIKEISTPSPDPLAAIRYSCLYWVNHLNDAVSKGQSPDWMSEHDSQENRSIATFLRQSYLYWLEALSLLGNIPDGIRAMIQLESFFQHHIGPIVALVYDSRRFIQYNKLAIEAAPLQTYASVLVFSPRQSIIRQSFSREEPRWISQKPVVEDDWSACMSTLEGHSRCVYSVAFSPDGQQIVSGSEDDTIKIWDRQSGVCVSTLEGHSGMVSSVAFSPDGLQIVSGAWDGTIKVWDRQGSACVSTFDGHSAWVNSVAFSPDGQQIISGSYDYTIKIWDRQGSACVLTLKGHSDAICSVSFSPDGRQIVSGSNDHTVKIWDRQSGICVSTLEGHSGFIRSVAFSPDGLQIVSSSEDQNIKVWDRQSSACVSTLEGHSDDVRSVAFSPDGLQIVSGSEDHTIKIWDRQSGTCSLTLKDHSYQINSVAFSPDGQQIVSGSTDNAVQIWDLQSGAYMPTLEGHSAWVRSIAFSPDSQQIVSSSDDHTVKIWDRQSGSCLSTLKGHSNWVRSVAFSPDGQQIVSGSDDLTVKIWDRQRSVCVLTLEGHKETVNSVAFSPSGQQIVSGSYDYTIKLWDRQKGVCLLTFKGHRDTVCSVVFSPNGQQIASSSMDKTVKIWDRQSGTCLSTLEGHSWWVTSVAFSPDGQQIVSGSEDETVKIWDRQSGTCLSILEGYNGEINSVASIVGFQKTWDVNHSWITWKGQNILWLPLAYRPSILAANSNMLAIGCSSGRVWTIEFLLE